MRSLEGVERVGQIRVSNVWKASVDVNEEERYHAPDVDAWLVDADGSVDDSACIKKVLNDLRTKSFDYSCEG